MIAPTLVPPQTQTQYVSGVADPFALVYRPVGRGGWVQVQSAVDWGYGAGVTAIDTTPQYSSGGPIVTPGGLVSQTAYNTNRGRGVFSLPAMHEAPPMFWHLTIWAQEVIRDYTEDETISTEETISRQSQVSQLKARVRWTEPPGRKREIVLDIGTGLDLCIGPTTQIDGVEVMVPDPTSAPQLRSSYWTTEAGNPNLASLEEPRFRFDAYVQVSAWCTPTQTSHETGRYTQSVFVGRYADEGPPPVTIEQPIVDFLIPDNARVVQAFSTEDENNNPAEFLWIPPPIIGLPPSVGQTDFFGSQTNRVEVPQNSKTLRFMTGDDTVGRIMTAVFEGQQ